MILKIKENILIISIIFLGGLLIGVGIYFSQKSKHLDIQEFVEERDLKDCKTSISRVVTVSDGNDVYPAGTELEVEMNYYNCNVGKRDEVAMIMSPGKSQPIFKYIKIVPGDKFEVTRKDKQFYVEINGEVMKDPSGETYQFQENKSRMIKLYESNFVDGVKEGVYFVFGSSLGGGFDSTRFGPVTNERMVGRVVRVLGQDAKAL